ncbi:TatD family hydrolase [Patescibacteria group bacterium]|nr:TatD family hydrolase [Patescibacteria group bacterium]
MSLIDTHTHLQFEAYDEDRDEVVRRNSKELKALVNVGTSIDTSEKGIELARRVKNFYASVGVHPHHVDQWDSKTYNTLKTLAKNSKVVAVGETGLDKHVYKDYPEPDLRAQAKILEEHINLALELNKPILFHCRDAYDDLYDQINKYKGKISGLMHCYMGTWEQAKKFLGLGLYISFSGNITYKGNDYIRDIAKKLPEEVILTETDSPYLSPEPRRGNRNEPIYVKMVADCIAALKGWKSEKITTITTQNADDLFGFPL